jgi:hypothetical protein
MRAVLPLHLTEIDQPHVGFVDEGGRLQRVARPLPGHLPACQSSQLPMDDRNELLQRLFVAIFPSDEEMRDDLAGHIGHGDQPRFVRENGFYSTRWLDEPVTQDGYYSGTAFLARNSSSRVAGGPM